MSHLIKRTASNMHRYVRARAEHEYNEVSLHLETRVRVTKEYLQNTMPGKVYTDIGKVFSSYKRMRQQQTPPKSPSADRGRIDKDKRYMPENRVDKDKRNKLVNGEATRYRFPPSPVRTSPETPFEKRARRSVEALRAKAQHTERAHHSMASSPLLNHPRARSFHPEPAPEPEYMDKLCLLHPPSDDHNERQAHINKNLESILGPERMKAGVVTPSGHSGMTEDPVLAQWNKEKFYNGVLDCVHDYDTQKYRHQQDLQHQAEEKEMKRQQDSTLLEHHLIMYRHRVEQLTLFGPKFHIAIDSLEQAANNDDILSICQISQAMCNDILKPAQDILDAQKHDALINIELEGAQLLREAWPLDRLDQVLRLLQPEMSRFPDEVQNYIQSMLKGIELACSPILCAQAFKNPLAQEPQLPFAAQPIPKSLAHHLADFGYLVPRQQYQAPQKLQFQQYQPPSLPPHFQQGLQPQLAQQAPAGDNAGKNFSSFSDLVNASKAAAANPPPISAINIIPPTNVRGAATCNAPVGTDPAATNANGTPQANILDSLRHIMYMECLDFEEDLKNLVRDGKINARKRQTLSKVLKSMDDCHGQDGLLGVEEDRFRMWVETVIKKIANLSNRKERNHADTRRLEVLAHSVLKLWSRI